MLQVGSSVPSAIGWLADGGEVDLGAPSGRPRVVYFYPRAFTPVCTQQAWGFRDAHAELARVHGAELFGVSHDPPERLERFRRQHRLTFELVSDRHGDLARAFGVQRLGGLVPFAKRVTFVLDGEATVRGVFHHEMDAQRHVDEVRRCLEMLAPPRVAASERRRDSESEH